MISNAPGYTLAVADLISPSISSAELAKEISTRILIETANRQKTTYTPIEQETNSLITLIAQLVKSNIRATKINAYPFLLPFQNGSAYMKEILPKNFDRKSLVIESRAHTQRNIFGFYVLFGETSIQNTDLTTKQLATFKNSSVFVAPPNPKRGWDFVPTTAPINAVTIINPYAAGASPTHDVAGTIYEGV